MSELKSCPFCGGAEIMELGIEYAEDFRHMCVLCKSVSGRYRTRQEAIDAWNTRHVTDQPLLETSKDGSAIERAINHARSQYGIFQHLKDILINGDVLWCLILAAEEREVLMLRSVLAMAIAEGDEGWEMSSCDCPMLQAVYNLKQLSCTRQKETI